MEKFDVPREETSNNIITNEFEPCTEIEVGMLIGEDKITNISDKPILLNNKIYYKVQINNKNNNRYFVEVGKDGKISYLTITNNPEDKITYIDIYPIAFNNRIYFTVNINNVKVKFHIVEVGKDGKISYLTITDNSENEITQISDKPISFNNKIYYRAHINYKINDRYLVEVGKDGKISYLTITNNPEDKIIKISDKPISFNNKIYYRVQIRSFLDDIDRRLVEVGKNGIRYANLNIATETGSEITHISDKPISFNNKIYYRAQIRSFLDDNDRRLVEVGKNGIRYANLNIATETGSEITNISDKPISFNNKIYYKVQINENNKRRLVEVGKDGKISYLTITDNSENEITQISDKPISFNNKIYYKVQINKNNDRRLVEVGKNGIRYANLNIATETGSEITQISDKPISFNNKIYYRAHINYKINDRYLVEVGKDGKISYLTITNNPEDKIIKISDKPISFDNKTYYKVQINKNNDRRLVEVGKNGIRYANLNIATETGSEITNISDKPISFDNKTYYKVQINKNNNRRLVEVGEDGIKYANLTTETGDIIIAISDEPIFLNNKIYYKAQVNNKKGVYIEFIDNNIQIFMYNKSAVIYINIENKSIQTEDGRMWKPVIKKQNEVDKLSKEIGNTIS